jgi:ABC-type transporter Mla subunit MlaD
MNRTVIDLWVGVFVAIGIAAFLFLALKVGNLSSGTCPRPTRCRRALIISAD